MRQMKKLNYCSNVQKVLKALEVTRYGRILIGKYFQ